jgi:hypothetical protein
MMPTVTLTFERSLTDANQVIETYLQSPRILEETLSLVQEECSLTHESQAMESKQAEGGGRHQKQPDLQGNASSIEEGLIETCTALEMLSIGCIECCDFEALQQWIDFSPGYLCE